MIKGKRKRKAHSALGYMPATNLMLHPDPEFGNFYKFL
jgi:hypothetical protein